MRANITINGLGIILAASDAPTPIGCAGKAQTQKDGLPLHRMALYAKPD
jgi:hypothetical protein